MTIATTTFLQLNQNHFKTPNADQQLPMKYLPEYLPTPSQSSETNDCYHHFPYHYVLSHAPRQFHHHHCPPHVDHYADVRGSSSGKSYAHHTYQTIGPNTISSNIQHHQYKQDNLGNIEIIESKKARSYDMMND